MTLQISIIGLNQIGVSLGLALGNHKDLVRRIGSDIDTATMRRAEKMGAVDSTTYNLPSAARQADLIVLDVAVDDLEETFKAIAQDLKESVVVIDTSPVKVAAMEMAKKFLPDGQSYVSWTPAMNPSYLREPAVGIDATHADFFQNSLVYITAPMGTRAEALKLASDLVTLVGGTPMFADPYEVDGLIAANHQLPGLVAASLINTLQDQPGWREGKRLAGKALAESLMPVEHLDERESLGQSYLLNKDNVLRLIDNYVASLLSLRELIASDNAKDLTSQLKHAIGGEQSWLQERKEAPWLSSGKTSQVDVPTAGEIWGRLIGLGGKKKTR